MEYDEISYLLIQWGGIVRVDAFKEQFFTPRTFTVLQICFSLFLILSILFKNKLCHLVKFKIQFFQWLKSKLIGSWSVYTIEEKLVVLVISFVLLVVRLLFLMNWEYYEDEAFSFHYLVSKGVLTTLTYYPGPNNHVLYNLICSFLNYSGLPEIWVMRLPSVIVSGLMFYVCIPILKTKFDFRTSLIISLLTQVSFNFFLYSFQGRGYVLDVFFVVLSFYALYRFTKSRNENYGYLFIVSSVLGFFTIPIFLYPFVSILAFFLLMDFSRLKELLLFGLIISIGGVFCYSPIFIVSGFESVFANDWVKPLPFEQFIKAYPMYLVGLQDWLWDLPQFGVGVSLLISGFVILKLKDKQWFWVAFFAFIVPFWALIVQGVLPFPRVWTYWTLVQGLCLGILFDYINSKVIFYSLMLLFILSQAYSFYIIL